MNNHIKNQTEIPDPIMLRARIMTMKRTYNIKLTNKFLAEKLAVSETTISKGFLDKAKSIRLRISELLDQIETENKKQVA